MSYRADTPGPKSQDDLLEEAHNEYIDRIAESGLPLWVADMYGFHPDISENLCGHSHGGIADSSAETA